MDATGNFGGPSGNFVGNNASYKGNDGTGGLLVIYSDKYNNSGTIEANGVASTTTGRPSGGASRRWFCKYIL